MALYYTLPIVILNKMAVKLDFLSCRRADVISRQSQRSRINSGGGSLLLAAWFLKGGGWRWEKRDISQDFDNLIIVIFNLHLEILAQKAIIIFQIGNYTGAGNPDYNMLKIYEVKYKYIL